MFELKIRRVGNSLGVTLPAEAVRRLGLGAGDALYLTETADGFRLTAHDPDFARAMREADGFMARYRNALRALAE